MGSFRQSPNGFLAALPEADFELLRPQLRAVPLNLGERLIETGAPLRQVYFPHSGVISKLVLLDGGESIEVALIGRDCVFGGSASIYASVSPTSGIVRYPGNASIIDVPHFLAALENSAALRAALMERQWLHIVQAERTAACNAAHSIEQRLCRRLLMVRDLASGDKLPLTQDIIAQMLGVQRNSVSLIAIELQTAGLIRYSRGQLEIVCVDGLRERACGCYEHHHYHAADHVADEQPPDRVHS